MQIKGSEDADVSGCGRTRVWDCAMTRYINMSDAFNLTDPTIIKMIQGEWK